MSNTSTDNLSRDTPPPRQRQRHVPSGRIHARAAASRSPSSFSPRATRVSSSSGCFFVMKTAVLLIRLTPPNPICSVRECRGRTSRGRWRSSSGASPARRHAERTWPRRAGPTATAARSVATARHGIFERASGDAWRAGTTRRSPPDRAASHAHVPDAVVLGGHMPFLQVFLRDSLRPFAVQLYGFGLRTP